MDKEKEKEQEKEQINQDSPSPIENGRDSENHEREKIENDGAQKTQGIRKEPSLNDYLAGAMLANGVIWMWMQLIQIFGSRISEYSIIADLSFIVFILAGYVAAFQVGKRIDVGHLTAGLKTAGYGLIMALIIMYTSWPAASSRLALTLMICLVFGGVLGGYMNIRRRIKLRRRDLKASS